MKKGMYLICRVYLGRILFFFISSASLLFGLLFGNFFFSVNFFHTHERPNRKFSCPSWSYVSIAFFLSSTCLLPIFKKKMNKEIGLAKFLRQSLQHDFINLIVLQELITLCYPHINWKVTLLRNCHLVTVRGIIGLNFSIRDLFSILKRG